MNYRPKFSLCSLVEFYELQTQVQFMYCGIFYKWLKILGGIKVSHPFALSSMEQQSHLRNRFFHGLQDSIRSNLRHKFDQGATYSDLLISARGIESEQNITAALSDSNKTKAKASSLQSQISDNYIAKLEKAYQTCQGEYRKLQQQMETYEKAKPIWAAAANQASQFMPPPIPSPAQALGAPNDNNQGSRPPNQGGGRGTQSNQPYYRGDYRGRGGYFKGRGRGYQRGNCQPMPDPPGKPQGYNRLCFWCRDFVAFEEADHKMRDCPFYEKGKKEWWEANQPHSHPSSVPPDQKEN